MRRSCKVWLSLSVTLSLAGLIQPMLVAKPGEKSKVTICVYDHSGLKAGTLAQSENVSLSQTLGPAIAHEIGHLLLRSNAHSAAGVMQPCWRGKDLHQASQGLLLFTAEQAEFIRAEVIQRMTQREVVQGPEPSSLSGYRP